MQRLTKDQKRARQLKERAGKARATGAVRMARREPNAEDGVYEHSYVPMPIDDAEYVPFQLALKRTFEDPTLGWFAFAPERRGGVVVGGDLVTMFNVNDDDDGHGVQIWLHGGRFGGTDGTEDTTYLDSIDDTSALASLGIDLARYRFIESTSNIVQAATTSGGVETALAMLHGMALDEIPDDPREFQRIPGWYTWLTAHESHDTTHRSG